MGALFMLASAVGIFFLGWFRIIVFDSFFMEAAFTFLPAGMAGSVVSMYIENIMSGIFTAIVIFGVILLAGWLTVTGQVPNNMDQYIVAENVGAPWNRASLMEGYSIKLTNTSDQKILIDHLTYDVYDCDNKNQNVDSCDSYPSLGREDFSTKNQADGLIILPHHYVIIHPQLNTPTFVDIEKVEVDKIGVGAYSLINNQ